MKHLGPGVHDGVQASDYHADPCERPSLSNSIIKVLLGQSPGHARARHPRITTFPDYEWPQTDAMKIGAVAHAILLGAGDTYVVFNPGDYLTKDGKPCVTLGCAEAQAAIAEARAAGHIDINQKLKDKAQAVADQMIVEILNDYPLWATGESEVTIVFEYRLNDGSMILCRCRIDRLVLKCVCVESRDVHVHAFDIKCTGLQASDEWLDKTIALGGWATQEAFYVIGLDHAFPLVRDDVRFSFVVGETYPPYATRFVTIPSYWRDDARDEIDQGANIWGACLASGIWPQRPKRYEATRPEWISARLEAIVAEEESE